MAKCPIMHSVLLLQTNEKHELQFQIHMISQSECSLNQHENAFLRQSKTVLLLPMHMYIYLAAACSALMYMYFDV